MKVSDLKPLTTFRHLKDESRWMVTEDGNNRKHVLELNYHCVDCAIQYDMDTKTPDGDIWVDEIFGENFFILTIPVDQIEHGVDYTQPHRITASNGDQVITGIAYSTKYSNVLELWPDDATSYIHINLTEWHVREGFLWRIIPEFPKYEMTREGVVRNGETGSLLTPYPRGKSLSVNIAKTTRSLAKLYHQTFPERDRMEFPA